MSELLARIPELQAGKVILEDCPWCTANQKWWMPGDPDPKGVEPEHDWEGLTCWQKCGYVVKMGPPTILCAMCGAALEKIKRGFQCEPCGRDNIS